jgi:hypothetical protein
MENNSSSFIHYSRNKIEPMLVAPELNCGARQALAGVPQQQAAMPTAVASATLVRTPTAGAAVWIGLIGLAVACVGAGGERPHAWSDRGCRELG